MLSHSNLISKSCGWLFFISLLISLLHGFQFDLPIFISGALTLFASILLFPKLITIQKFQVLFLVITGVTLLYLSGNEWLARLEKSITINYAVIAIVISVSFLRLVIKQKISKENLPSGNKALLKTILGFFTLTSVINFSSIVIFGDRLSKDQKLNKPQLMILSRMFGANALYSPFFVSMGAALIYSGGADFKVLLLIGFVMALVSILLTLIQCRQIIREEKLIFEGYPMNIDNLFIPVLLTCFVLISHFIFKDVSILILVSAVIVFNVFVILIYRDIKKCIFKFKQHVENNLSNSASEVILFFSAGIFAVGISEFSQAANFILPIDNFVGYHAVISLLLMILISLIGVHPIISISVLGGLLQPLNPEPNLLGLMFIFSWGLSVLISPLSAVSLLMQSRYKMPMNQLLSINLSFTIIMFTLACLILVFYGN